MDWAWNDNNLGHAEQHKKMFSGNLTKTQAKIALLLALQLRGKRHAYTRGVTNVATTKKQQIA